MIIPNEYERRRKEAEQRLFQQLASRQRYVDAQSAREEQDYQRQLAEEAQYKKTQEQAAPGNREIDWAGKGLAAGGPWGALIGAVGARVANAYDRRGEGVKGVGTSLFGLGDLKRGLQSKQGNIGASSLAGGMGQEMARRKTAARPPAASGGFADEAAMHGAPAESTQQDFGTRTQGADYNEDFKFVGKDERKLKKPIV